jgi:hypothetical protein
MRKLSQTTSIHSVILGGSSNCILSNSIQSFIGGGSFNEISSASSIANVILGGRSNLVGNGSYSTILGGENNIITGSCNAILGGSNNNDGGFNFVGISGNAVNGAMNNAFHANCFYARNMPSGIGVAQGHLFYRNFGGVCPLFIMP